MPFNTDGVVYNNKHSLRVKFGHNSADSDEKAVTVKVAVDDNVLCIKLYDDDDVSFNYTATINVVAYEKIKTEQSLDIEFDEFKTQLMELLKQALNNKMFLRLEITDNICRMVFYEKSKLKSLIFLIVDLKPTDYNVIITELSEMINNLKCTKRNLESQLDRTKKNLQGRDLELRAAEKYSGDLQRAFYNSLGDIENYFNSQAIAFEKNVSCRLSQVFSHVQSVFNKVEAVRDEIRAKDELIGSLTRTLNAERVENERANQIAYDYKVKADSTQRVKEEMEGECERLRQSLKNMDLMLSDLKKKCDEQAKDLEKAAIVIVQKQKSHDEISRDLVQANNMIVNFNQHYEKALKELEEVKNREVNKSRQLEEQTACLKEIAREFDDYKKLFNESEVERLKNELYSAQHKIVELEKNNREVNKINALLTRRLSEGGFYNGK